MPRSSLSAVLACLLLLAASPALGAGSPAGTQAAVDDAGAARERLDEARRTYAAAGPFEETLDLTLTLPDGTTGKRQQVYGVTAAGGAYLTLSADGNAGLVLVASGGRAIAVWSHIAERYAEAPYTGDLAAALAALDAGQAGIGPPPAVVAAQGGELDAFVDSLRFGILGPIESTLLASSEGAGEARQTVTLVAANGQVTLALDPVSHRFLSVELELGEGEQQIRASGTFRFAPGPPAAPPGLPDLAARGAVATLPALEASEYPLGEPAPAAELQAVDGETVRLADLAGQVVVLDFWATWCVPCWTALEHTAELAAWAASSGLPVKVFAVDTLERTTGFEEQRDLAGRFLAERGLDLPVLLDVGNGAFKAFHNPGLPSLVIIGPDGRLAGYRSGVSPDMVESVRAEVLTLLE